jgi:hypothetical protein
VDLGKFDSPESRREYARIVAELTTSPAARPIAPSAPGAALAEVLLAFLKHAELHYRRADGTTTNELVEAIGVEDNDDLTGCSRRESALLDIEKRVRSDLVRDAKVSVRRVEIRTTKDQRPDFLFLYRVQYSEEKVVETNKGEAYIRRANTRHPLTDDEKRELQRERGQRTFEVLV